MFSDFASRANRYRQNDKIGISNRMHCVRLECQLDQVGDAQSATVSHFAAELVTANTRRLPSQVPPRRAALRNRRTDQPHANNRNLVINHRHFVHTCRCEAALTRINAKQPRRGATRLGDMVGNIAVNGHNLHAVICLRHSKQAYVIS